MLSSAKIFALAVLFFFSDTNAATAQPLTINAIAAAGRFTTCSATYGLPVVTGAFVSGGGSSVVNGALACQNSLDSTILDFTISNIRWNQSPNIIWLHGVFFTANTGITILSTSLGTGWIFKTSCTGSSCSAQVAGGPGYYYDGTAAQSCCSGGTLNDNNPANNYGTNLVTCTTPFTISFRLKVKNSSLTGLPIALKMRGTSDGATGCWNVPDASVNTIQFQFPTVTCTQGFICNPAGSTTYAAGLSGSTYQWQMSTDSLSFSNIADGPNYSNTNSAAVSLLNIPSSWYGREYRCLVDGVTYSLVKTLKVQNTWTGLVSTDWNTPGNWSCNTVPDTFTDAIISSGTVNVTSDCSVRSVITGSGVIFTVNPGVVFTVLH